MGSLVFNTIFFGLAYVLLVYLIMTFIKPAYKRNKNNNDEGDGGVEDTSPPKIDLPPGVIWPSDSPKTKEPAPPMEV